MKPKRFTHLCHPALQLIALFQIYISFLRSIITGLFLFYRIQFLFYEYSIYFIGIYLLSDRVSQSKFEISFIFYFFS